MNDELYPYVKGRKYTKFEAKLELLLLAQGTDTTRNVDGNPFPVRRGSYWTSIRFLVNRWQWSRKKVVDFLDYLEKDQFLAKRGYKTGTLITIVNYHEYNPLGDYASKIKDVKRTQRGHEGDKYNKGNKEIRSIAGKPAPDSSSTEGRSGEGTVWQMKVGPIIDYLTDRFGALPEGKSYGGIAGKLMNVFANYGNTGEEVVWILKNHADKPKSAGKLFAYIDSFDRERKMELASGARRDCE